MTFDRVLKDEEESSPGGTVKGWRGKAFETVRNAKYTTGKY